LLSTAMSSLPVSAQNSNCTVWTAPLKLGGANARISLNADGVKGMTVEIADENFRLLPAFSGKNAGVSTASHGLDCALVWPARNFDAIRDQKVRLLVRLRKGDYPEPRLFAVYATCD